MSDLIEREAAIDAIERIRSVDTYADLEYAKDIFRKIPPAQSEQKVGRWILHPEWEIDGECSATCSECEMGVDVLYNFCPRCGAKMKNKE